jgi:SAM-dependent methyltransferase
MKRPFSSCEHSARGTGACADGSAGYAVAFRRGREAGVAPPRRLRVLPLIAVLLLGALAACSTPPRPAAEALRGETSVKPGINQEFLRPESKVTDWVQRFEGESREVFVQRQAIVNAARIRRGMEIADIGAGTGLFEPLFAAAAGPKGTVYAVDISKDFIQHIAAKAAESKLTNVVPVLCTERSVELPARSIDLAFICDTYHHFEYPRNTLASLHRALRSRGELLLIDFKRVSGVSSDWTLNHVRAGQEVFTAEIEAAGFKKVEEVPLLKDNYILRFRKARR